MFDRKISIILIFLISLLSISAVNAVSIADSDIADSNNDLVSVEETPIISQTQDNEVLSLGNASFADLEKKIADANESSTITLDDDYLYSDEYNNTNGITIDKTLTIDGNGHTIDANKKARIFTVTASGVVFRNIVFINAHSEGDGGAVNGDITAINCTFQENYANGNGGAIYNGDAVNCSFIGNCAEKDGGAIYGGNATGCNFTDNNYAGEHGGAIYSGNAVNCIFNNNAAKHHGGAVFNGNVANCQFNNNGGWLGSAIYNENASFTVINSTFNGHNAYEGGAIYNVISNTPVENCYFKDNRAYHGGAIYNGEVKNSIFENNGVIESDGDDDGDGGAIYGGSALNCTFTGNYADDDGDGGALSHSHAENCTFTNNWADDNGGALYYTDAVNCNFTGNYADDDGGAIYKGSASYCNFTKNSADGTGGAIYEGSASHCDFTENYADDDGGAIYNGHASYCNFIKNKVDDDGAAIFRGHASHCNFNDNYANGDGGAVGYCDAEYCNFINNHADGGDGGAIYRGGASKCNFTGNSADDNGGAIYLGKAKDCTFKNNHANEKGGAVYNTDDEDDGYYFLIEYCTFDGNSATYGSASYYCDVSHCTFINNWASDTSTVNGAKVYECHFKNNKAGRSPSCCYKCTIILCTFEQSGNLNPDIIGECTVVHIDFTVSGNNNVNIGDKFKISLTSSETAYNLNGFDVKVTVYLLDGTVFSSFKVLSGDEWTVDLPKGEYNITFEISIYKVTKLVTVNSPVHISANDIHATYGDEEYYVITLKDNMNRPIANAEVNITFIDSKIYTTDENGTIIFPTIDLSPGTYVSKVIFDNKTYNLATIANTIVIDKQFLSLTPSTLVTTYNSGDVLIISLQDRDYNPMNNISLSVDLNGTENYTTDENGQIYISSNGLIPDKYMINVTYGGNEFYYQSNATATILVNKDVSKLVSNSLVTTYNSGEELIINLNSGFDNPISDALIYVDLNGTRKYTTDENGQVKISLEGFIPETYNVNITFKGNNLYLKSKFTTKIVIEKISTKISSENKSMNYKFPQEFLFDIKDNQGNPARNVTVVLDINGSKTFTTDENGQIKIKIYSDSNIIITLNDANSHPVKGVVLSVDLNGVENYTTDENGQVNISTKDLTPDTYLVNITFAGNDIYKKSTGSSVLVIDKSITNLTVNNVETTYGVNNDLIISLLDSGDNPISNATVLVDLDGVKKYVTDEYGLISIPTHNLTPNNYVAKITFDGDEINMGCEVQANVVVNKIVSKLTANMVSTSYSAGDDLIIILEDYSGNPISNAPVLVDLNGIGKYYTDEKGCISVPLSDLVPGTYVAKISFAEDEYYFGSKIDTSVVFNQIFTKLTANNVTTTHGSNDNFIISLKDVYNNPISNVSVSVVLDGVKTYITNQNGQIIIPTNDLKSGRYVASVSFGGNTYYVGSDVDAEVVVNKAVTKLTANNVTTTHGSNDNFIISLKDVYNNPISNVSVSVDLNGVEDYVTNVEGKIIVPISDLIPDIYNAKISFGGNDYYVGSDVDAEVVVNKAVTKLIADNVTTTYGSGDDLVIGLMDGDGNPVSNVSVSVDLNGVGDYVTNVEGRIIVATSDLIPDTYNAKISFAGNDYYDESNMSIAVLVEKATPVLNLNSGTGDLIKYYLGPERFTVSITDVNGIPLSDSLIFININNVEYNRTADDSGEASIALNLAKGNYSTIVSYNGNDYYKSVNATADVVIKSTVTGEDVVKVEKGSEPYSASFLDSEGNPLADGTAVLFNINGVIYNRTVKDGVGKLNLNLAAGEYIITVINPANGEMSSNNITILPRLIENKDITKYFRNATQYTLKVLDDDGKAVGVGVNVTFNINGVFYTRQTNESGIVKMNINLAPGEYVITAEYKGCKVSNNITVLPVLNATDLTKKYGDSDPFVVTLLDGQGNRYANQNMTFNINGVFYSKTTDSEGNAKLNINLMAGEYIITSTFESSKISNTITVTS